MKKESAYLLLVTILVLTEYVWLTSSGSLLHAPGSGIYLALGRLTGLLLGLSILFQFVIIGRVGWMEKTFGLDKLSKLHHITGFTTVLFLFAHPIFLAIAYRWGDGSSFFGKIISLISMGDDVTSAAFGALLFIIVAATSVYVLLKKLKYEYWYGIHMLAYAGLVISFNHQLELGGDLHTVTGKLMWVGLFVWAGITYIWFRFIKPLINFGYHRFYVKEIIEETDKVRSIRISGKHMNECTYQPGQFVIVRFFAKGIWWEAHPFSISVGEGRGDLRITVKMLGDYTKKMWDAIHIGTQIFIDGPHGVFGNSIASAQKILCIAGGVGITPIRSVTQEAVRLHKNIKVLASFSNSKEAFCEQEIAQLVGNENMQSVYTRENPYDEQKKGITHSTVLDFCPDVRERDIYICGPVPFMEHIKRMLKSQGVSKNRIHYEKFSL